MGRLQVDDELTGQLGQTRFHGDVCVLVCSLVAAVGLSGDEMKEEDLHLLLADCWGSKQQKHLRPSY